jgi:hypothetical protein
MRDKKRAIADKLSSQEGANAANAVKSARVHEKTIGAHVMNAHVESHFGKADNCMRTYRNATAENIAGMVQQAYNQDFDQPLNVSSDRRKRKSDAPEPSVGGGFFWCNKLMTDELRSSLVSAVRKEACWHLRQRGAAPAEGSTIVRPAAGGQVARGALLVQSARRHAAAPLGTWARCSCCRRRHRHEDEARQSSHAGWRCALGMGRRPRFRGGCRREMADPASK